MKLDMHIHSYYSDGRFSPEEIIKKAEEEGLYGVALTDHDTIRGLEEFMNYETNLKLIPGLEFTTYIDRAEIHILAYFIDRENKELLRFLDFLEEEREERFYKMIDRLSAKSISLEGLERFQGFKGALGRPHVAELLIENGYATSMKMAFEDYLSPGKFAYVDRERKHPGEIIDLIHRAGGLAVVAHPNLIKYNRRENLKELVRLDLDGIECFHSTMNKAQTRKMLNLAKNNELIITGGSDCHGRLVNNEILLGKYFVDLNKSEKLKSEVLKNGK